MSHGESSEFEGDTNRVLIPSNKSNYLLPSDVRFAVPFYSASLAYIDRFVWMQKPVWPLFDYFFHVYSKRLEQYPHEEGEPSNGLLLLLRCFPSIAHITLEEIDVDNLFCKKLSQDSDTIPCVQILEFIRFPCHFGTEEFTRLLRARSPGSQRDEGSQTAVPFKKATLSLVYKSLRFDALTPHGKATLQQLNREGLEGSVDLV